MLGHVWGLGLPIGSVDHRIIRDATEKIGRTGLVSSEFKSFTWFLVIWGWFGRRRIFQNLFINLFQFTNCCGKSNDSLFEFICGIFLSFYQASEAFDGLMLVIKFLVDEGDVVLLGLEACFKGGDPCLQGRRIL